MRVLAGRAGFKVRSMRFRSSTLGLRASLQYWYDDQKGSKGDRPFLSNRALRMVSRIWRRLTDLLRLGDTVEYRLGKRAPGGLVE